MSAAVVGFDAPPHPVRLRLAREGKGWSIHCTGPAARGRPLADWLAAMGAVRVESDNSRGSASVRGTFRDARAAWDTLAAAGVQAFDLRVDGTASLLVMGSDDRRARLAAALHDLRAKEDLMSLEPMLTERQREVLAHVVARGYYQIPRSTTLRKLANELGISTTSLSLILRRAEAKIVPGFVARLQQ